MGRQASGASAGRQMAGQQQGGEVGMPSYLPLIVLGHTQPCLPTHGWVHAAAPPPRKFPSMTHACVRSCVCECMYATCCPTAPGLQSIAAGFQEPLDPTAAEAAAATAAAVAAATAAAGTLPVLPLVDAAHGASLAQQDWAAPYARARRGRRRGGINGSSSRPRCER